MVSVNGVIITAQVIGIIGMVIAMVTAVWSLLLQKKEVIKQNQRIIHLLERIDCSTATAAKAKG